jgi:hypothetical protein
MTWETLDAELPTLIGALLGVPCDWHKKPRKMRQDVYATIHVLAPSTVGEADVLWSDVLTDPEDPETQTGVQATVVHQAEFTLQCNVWTRNQALEGSARRYLTRLRTRLRMPSSIASLRALGLSHVRTEGLVDTDPVEDNRAMSGATMDVRFAHSETEVDTEIPFIETVTISSPTTEGDGFYHAEGSPLAEALQADLTVPEP